MILKCSNPHPVRKLGAMRSMTFFIHSSEAFQSSPSPKTGRYHRINYAFIAGVHEFQSSPSPKTGRYFNPPEGAAFYKLSSNPHPVRKLGAIANATVAGTIGTVPILTQSENWALFGCVSSLCTSSVVPILTQSENWALFSNR